MSSFQDPSLPLSSYVLNFYTRLTLDIQFQTNTPPSPNDNQITNHWKENIIQGWLLYIIRTFLQVRFCFHYQLINLVWRSIDFFPFNWSKPRPQSCFKKLKTSFSPSSYNEKFCWGQDWAEASLSAFLWLYGLVCAVV